MRLLFFLLFSISLFSQTEYPKDYFASPLDIPMLLSGNFGELRPNHFHAGFDIKTNKREGLNVYAVADGYVSRIKISIYGYGKAVYITHPNGFTSVYGHLQKAVGPIQDKIIETQYKEKNYEVELYLKPNELPVKKGQIIALSGNTGGSGGPHLHFEFRHSDSEKPINPLFFGYDKYIKDTRKPAVTNLLVYPLNDESVVNNSAKPLNLSLDIQKDGTYLAEKVYAKGKIGFGISSFDTDDVSWNNNGVYKTELFANGKVVYNCIFNEMVFDEGHYINALIDYPRYKISRQRVQELFMKKHYPLSNIEINKNDGIFDVNENFNQTLKIIVSDFEDNQTIINIPVQYKPQNATVVNSVANKDYFLKSSRENWFEKDNFSVYFPPNTFLQDFYLDLKVKDNYVNLHEDIVDAHQNFTLSFDVAAIPENEIDKTGIYSVKGNKLNYITTNRKGNTLSAKTKYLGNFKLVKDTTPPRVSISKSVEGKWISNQKTLNFTIADELSGINTYNGYLNGKWILFEYESKLNRLTHNFDDAIVAEGKNDLKLIVTDNAGNSTTFETQFFRSQNK
jgi:hypothetical protein